MNDTETLDNWRRQIDIIDDELLALLDERMGIVHSIGEYKKQHGLPPKDDIRWNDILTRLMAHNTSNLSKKAMTEIFAKIHDAALSIEKDHKTTEIPEYIFSKLSEIKNKINLGPGTPSVPPSQIYIQKLAHFISQKDAYTYPPYRATEEFALALIQWYKKRFAVSLSKDELLPLCGAKDGISHLPLALFTEGDEVLIPDPGYPAFRTTITIAGAVPVPYTLREANIFKIDVDTLESLLTKRTKAIWVNFPSNPTGQVATREELSRLVAFVKDHGLLILYDNAYSEITFDGYIAPSILQIQGAKDVAVEIGSFSKTFSFAGFRMGWIVGNKGMIGALSRTKTQMDSGLSLPLQHLGAFALSHTDILWQNTMIEVYGLARKKTAELLQTLGLRFRLMPGSLYIWAKIPDLEKDGETFTMRILKETGILLTPGIAFGKNGDRYVRASITGII